MVIQFRIQIQHLLVFYSNRDYEEGLILFQTLQSESTLKISELNNQVHLFLKYAIAALLTHEINNLEKSFITLSLDHLQSLLNQLTLSALDNNSHSPTSISKLNVHQVSNMNHMITLLGNSFTLWGFSFDLLRLLNSYLALIPFLQIEDQASALGLVYLDLAKQYQSMGYNGHCNMAYARAQKCLVGNDVLLELQLNLSLYFIVNGYPDKWYKQCHLESHL